MKFQRKRWIVRRKSDGKIYCGLAQNYKFKSEDDIGDTSIKTFLSEKKTISAVLSSYRGYTKDDVTAIPVWETIEEFA